MHKTWKIHLDTELGLIDIVFRGIVTKQVAGQSRAEAFALAAAAPSLFLVDLLDAKPDLSLPEIYGVPDEWSALGFNRANRLALVVPRGGKAWADAAFYETTCLNQGWQVAVFSQRQEAIDWLVRRPRPGISR